MSVYQSTAPGGLEDIFNMNPGAFWQAQGMIDQSNKQAQLDYDTGLQNLQFAKEKQPLTLQQLALGNQTQEAQLPGVTAYSNMLKRADANEALLNDETIKSLRGKMTNEEWDRNTKDVQNMGEFLRTGAERIRVNPFNGMASVKPKLQEAGLWNPQWDQLPWQQVVMHMNDLGNSINEMGNKFIQQKELLDIKDDAALERTRLQGEAAAERARTAGVLRLQAVQEAAKRREEAMKNKPFSMSQGEWSLHVRAMEGDTAARDELDRIQKDREAKAAAGAKENNDLKKTILGINGQPAKTGDRLPDGSIYIGK